MTLDHIETERLHGAPPFPGDRAAVEALGVTEAFDELLSHWSRHGYGVWLFRSKEDAKLVGVAGFRHGDDGNELLAVVRQDARNRGFAAEMAEAAIEAVHLELGLREFVAFATTDPAWATVLERLGFKKESERTAGGVKQLLYRKGGTSGR